MLNINISPHAMIPVDKDQIAAQLHTTQTI